MKVCGYPRPLNHAPGAGFDAQPYQPRLDQRRLIAVPVVLPDASRVVVRSVPPLVWVVAEPALRPLPSVSVVRSLPEPEGRVVAVPVVRPEASRKVVRSDVPVV